MKVPEWLWIDDERNRMTGGGGERRWNLSGAVADWEREQTIDNGILGSPPTQPQWHYLIGKERRQTHIRKYLNPFPSNRLSLQAGPTAASFPRILFPDPLFKKPALKMAESCRKTWSKICSKQWRAKRRRKETNLHSGFSIFSGLKKSF